MARPASYILICSLVGCSIVPERFQQKVISESSKQNIQQLKDEVEPFSKPVDLSQAIARAIKYNRDKRVKEFQRAIESDSLDRAGLDMLPSLTANAGYKGRDRYAMSTSVTAISQIHSSEPAISSDKNVVSSDIQFSWNVLDFGLSYLRAKQQADRFLISKEYERKATQNLVQDVRASYWRAVSATRLLNRIRGMYVRSKGALDDARRIEDSRIKAPLDILPYQRDLLDVERTLQIVQRDLSSAKTELGALMGVPPGFDFDLADVSNVNFSVPTLNFSIEDMEENALNHRPEMMETRYQSRITSQEARAALLQLLPGISFDTGTHFDGNSYTVNQHWIDWGVRVNLNLFNLVRMPSTQKIAKSKEQLGRAQQLALSAAVVTQVHLAWQRSTYCCCAKGWKQG
jgi:outer membrane protein TolC